MVQEQGSGASAKAETGSREPGLASRPGPSGFDPARWRAGSFRIDGGYARGLRLAGWLYGHFGVDRRQTGWAITHLPTGFSVGFVRDRLSKVRSFVEEIEAGGDWTFSDPEEARSRAKIVRHAEVDTGVKWESVPYSEPPEGVPARPDAQPISPSLQSGGQNNG